MLPAAALAPCAATAGASATAGVSAAAAQEVRSPEAAGERPRVREVGLVIGELPTGEWNAITDVQGVRVGHATILEGDSIRTGVTAILPHGGDLFREKVPGAIAVGNGFGKLVGATQVNELGEIETPILLTGTLSVFRAADALIDTLLSAPALREVRSINPVVGETNDGWLSDVRARPVGPEHVRGALRAARTGPVEEGSVGAGTGTRTLGYKGGIGTASRRVGGEWGEHRLGVLVQTNYSGSLRLDGVPVGAILAEEEAGGSAGRAPSGAGDAAPQGSVMIVLATDAPLAHRELERVAFRAFGGIVRTGFPQYHGSGDYAIAFSTARETPPTRDPDLLSALFRAAQEATEEAALNALFRATPVTGFRGRRQEALPVDRVVEILRRHGRIPGPAARSR